MPTPLTKELTLEVTIGKQPHTVTISPAGVKIIPKGKRKGGYEVTWDDLASGAVELDLRLKQSLRR